MADVLTVPTTAFTTDQLHQSERFEAWRQKISVIFDVSPLESEALPVFDAAVTGCHLERLLVGTTRLSGLNFDRSPAKIRADSLDHYIVQLYRNGSYVGEADGKTLAVRPGEVSILDLSRPLTTVATASETVTLVIPRLVMDEVLPGAHDLHGQVLRSDLGNLLSDHLHALSRGLTSIPAAAAPHLATATCELLAAAILPSVDNLARGRTAIGNAQLERAKHYIDQHLLTPALTPDRICKALAISRSGLYRLFDHAGGVERYIQKRRLQKARDALLNPREGRLISEIAYHLGFISEAHFSRSFKNLFGHSPREARQASREAVLQSPLDGRNSDLPGFDDWIRYLSLVA